ncbi:MAG: DUF4476 domain-containing protein [Ferruginibacter sp.]
MKYLKTGFITIFLLSFFLSKAQQNHFIYIQTEGKQPFYVKLNNNIYSSSSSGYLVLSKLKSGNYDLKVGFPKNEWPEQNVSCSIGERDLGYLLKNFAEKGWGLFNLQTLDVVMADAKEKKTTVAVETKNDEFSNLLSNVVNDPTIKQVDVVPQAPPPPAPVKEVVIEQPIVTTVSTDTMAIVSQEPETAPKSVIKKLLMNANAEGVDMVFIDLSEGNVDTVRVFIPKSAKAKSFVKQDEIVKEKPVIEMVETVATAPVPEKKQDEIKVDAKENNEPIVQEQKFIDMELPMRSKQTETKPVQPTNGVENAVIEMKVDNKEAPLPQNKEKVEENKPVPQSNGLENAVIEMKDVKQDSLIEVKEKPAEGKVIQQSNGLENAVIEMKEERAKQVENKPVPQLNSEATINTAKDSKLGSIPVKKEKQPEIILKKQEMINSDCKNLATDDDFMKLRRKMAGEESDDDMIAQAKKYFKSRCFTVAQVKNLSVLFLKDAGKYAFFDISYPFVSDSHNFNLLQSELIDPYYVNRFQAMIRH